MTLLLDTHVFLWWRVNSRRLKRTARSRIASAEIVWVSAASAWEVAIKQGLGKIRMSGSFSAMVHASEFQAMAITLEHAEATMDLPPHHADPFDRLLIAQARVEGATLVTHDERCRPYDVPILWV